jgi:SPW repeat
VLRYTHVHGGAWNAWVVGVVTVVLALWAIMDRRVLQGPPGRMDRLDAR